MSSFPGQVQKALAEVQLILDAERLRIGTPVVASADIPHSYEDKYEMAEIMTRAAIASQLTLLSMLGASTESLKQMLEWSRGRSVSLRLRAEEKCTFMREVKRDIESSKKVVSKGFFGTTTAAVVTTVIDYFWRFEYVYYLEAMVGSGEEVVLLASHGAAQELLTTTNSNPRKAVCIRDAEIVSVQWLLSHLDDSLQPVFYIDRLKETCRTPMRNKDVQAAIEYAVSMRNFCAAIYNYFSSYIFTLLALKPGGQTTDLGSIGRVQIFSPVLPLFNNNGDSQRSVALRGSQARSRGNIGTNMSAADIVLFVSHEERALRARLTDLEKTFINCDSDLISSVEAKFIELAFHGKEVLRNYELSMEGIEDMLRKQLVAAIGKVVSPSDFTNYMRFHNGKLFAPEFQPRPFCYAVRRSEVHSPEGVLSLEEQLADGSMADPVHTVVRASTATRPMRFTLNAATSVAFMGERYVHAWLRHSFEHSQYDPRPSIPSIHVQARQFSNFIVLLGRISSADTFDPKFGLIVQNQDEVTIPLDLEAIPSAKQFKQAIKSTSPEQQEFAKAFRGMQLESTLFGVCVIQIKPQMEKLLRLSPDSLTKEIQLTQDLMELFIKYQIPSDLLSFEGDECASSAVRIAAVKGYVQAMQSMIKQSKERELEEKKQEDTYKNKPGNLMIVDSSDDESEASGMAPLRACGFIDEISDRCEMMMECDAGMISEGGTVDEDMDLCFARAAPEDSRGEATVDIVEKEDEEAPELPQEDGESAESPQGEQEPEKNASSDEVSAQDFDVTALPMLLDQKFEELDKEGAVRPTIITPGQEWTKKARKALLADAKISSLGVEEQKTEKDRAFDLLDALSRSGGLTVDHASLHVVVAATHCFDRSIIDTLVMDNVNPIAKVERSTLIMATTVHERPTAELLRQDMV